MNPITLDSYGTDEEDTPRLCFACKHPTNGDYYKLKATFRDSTVLIDWLCSECVMEARDPNIRDYDEWGHIPTIPREITLTVHHDKMTRNNSEFTLLNDIVTLRMKNKSE